MIVHMMGQVRINKFMNRIKNLNCKSYMGLQFILLLFFSCVQEKEREVYVEKNNTTQKDSIVVSIEFIGVGEVGFNIPDDYLNNNFLSFKSETNDSTSIIKKIPITEKYKVIKYKGLVYNNNEFQKITQAYLLTDKTDTLKLTFLADNYVFSKSMNNIDYVFENYKSLVNEKWDVSISNKKKSILKLDTLYRKFVQKYSSENKSGLLQYNDIYYYNKLQNLDSINEEVDNFLKRTIDHVASKELYSLLYNYTKSRIKMFDYNALNEKKYGKKYLELIAIGHYNFLKDPDNKRDKKYQSAIDWLKTTDFYKKDSLHIKKKITPLDGNLFKTKIHKLILADTEQNDLSIAQVIKQNPSSYYLLDFWATWCAPCIKGVKIMNNMQLPKNIKVISISVDKDKDKQKWKTKTKELEQPLSYWIDETDSDTKEFIKFIEMQSIPRYILIDKDMNLIDQAFYHPQEPQFLSKLKDVKNHKYW